MVAHPESEMLDVVRPDSPLSRLTCSFFQESPKVSKNVPQKTLLKAFLFVQYIVHVINSCILMK